MTVPKTLSCYYVQRWSINVVARTGMIHHTELLPHPYIPNMVTVNNGTAIFNEVPQGLPVLDKTIVFKSESIDLDTVQLNGGILVKALYLSIDPYLKLFMRDPSVESWAPPFSLGKA